MSPSVSVDDYLVLKGSAPLKTGIKYADLLRRPEISYEDLKCICPNMPEVPKEVSKQAEIRIKYEGYIKRQQSQIAAFKKLENKRLSDEIDYNEIKGLRIEAKQKLNKIKPVSVGQASRISGVSPSDIAVLLIYLEGKGSSDERKN